MQLIYKNLQKVANSGAKEPKASQILELSDEANTYCVVL